MTLFLSQIVVVLLVAHACGWLAIRVGQARVVGQMMGGILLGPSVFGRMLPTSFARLFPPASLAPFEVLSTVGLILFLFIIGTEVDVAELHRYRGTALLASGMSILFPFTLAVGMAPALQHRFAPAGNLSVTFVLFLGISMSITAFPVLARLLEENDLNTTPLGTLAIFCAAVDDIVAWLLLALALAVRGSESHLGTLPLRLAALLFFGFIMLCVLRPIASRFVRSHSPVMSYETLALTLVGVFASAAVTDAIGVHPLFGAFLAGVCLPRQEQWQRSFRARLESTVGALLLPLFFAVTGMRTRFDLLDSRVAWLWVGVILCAACVGKFAGAVLAARITGQSLTTGLALGALLNTRGLVELVVLNIAYEMGIFSTTLFTILVIMALVTTCATSPILKMLHVERAGDHHCEASPADLKLALGPQIRKQ